MSFGRPYEQYVYPWRPERGIPVCLVGFAGACACHVEVAATASVQVLITSENPATIRGARGK